MKKIYVFFDGKCNLCSKEINYYKKKDLKQMFQWVDINLETEKLKIYEIEYNDSLKFLHVIDKKGNIKIGVEAFMTIWDELNYWRLLSLLIRVKPIKFIVDLCYNFWAKRRYNRLDYKCDVKEN